MQEIGEDVVQPALLKVWGYTSVPLLFQFLFVSFLAQAMRNLFLKSSLICGVSQFLISCMSYRK